MWLMQRIGNYWFLLYSSLNEKLEQVLTTCVPIILLCTVAIQNQLVFYTPEKIALLVRIKITFRSN